MFRKVKKPLEVKKKKKKQRKKNKAIKNTLQNSTYKHWSALRIDK
jgi:hypothetical protein